MTVDLAAGYAIDSFGRRDTLVSIEGATGTSLDDTLYGSSAANKLYGMDGDDILDGRGGGDELYGGYGGDVYYIDNAGDKIFDVSNTDDRVSLDAVHTTLDINLTNTKKIIGDIEFVWLEGSAHKAIGNLADNTIYGNKSDNIIEGKNGNDSLFGFSGNNTISGGYGDDVISSDDGNDYIDGGSGNDILGSGAGIDIFLGGNGNDTIVFGKSVVVSLADPGKNKGDAAGDKYTSIENILGSRQRDTLEGDEGANVIDGNLGRDTLTGGGGADMFQFTAWFDGTYDTITDFVPGVDRISLESDRFYSLNEGDLVPSAFIASTSGQATKATHQIVYETDTGKLRFDSDGSGSVASIHFATLTPGLALTHEDFLVI